MPRSSTSDSPASTTAEVINENVFADVLMDKAEMPVTDTDIVLLKSEQQSYCRISQIKVESTGSSQAGECVVERNVDLALTEPTYNL